MTAPVGYSSYLFLADDGPMSDRPYDIFYRDDSAGPPVVILHELYGLSETTFALADHLAAASPQFSPFLPLLFGEANTSSLASGLKGLFCLRKQITLFATGKTSPLVSWLRKLIADVAQRTESESVGVIGMCLTGGMVFGLVAEANVSAAVASQPSFPARVPLMPSRGASLGLSSEDLANAALDDTPVTVLRYSNDPLCPAARMDSARELFGGTDQAVADAIDPAVSVAIGDRVRTITVAGKAHSVLTDDLNVRARDLVTEFLAAAL
ncbi:MAG: hypothetical protein HKN07_09060 [Acidimicrobiia bacterium]|nr:hypothetical protein [Acidimicrobiia bacterium]